VIAYLAGVATGITLAWLWSLAVRARRHREWQAALLRKAPATRSNVNVVPAGWTLTTEGTATYTARDAADRAAAKVAADLAALREKLTGTPEWRPCPGCHGEGVVDGDTWDEICTTCHGSGDAR